MKQYYKLVGIILMVYTAGICNAQAQNASQTDSSKRSKPATNALVSVPASNALPLEQHENKLTSLAPAPNPHGGVEASNNNKSKMAETLPNPININVNTAKPDSIQERRKQRRKK